MRKNISEFNANPEVLKNYNLLKELGLWDQLNALSKQISAQEELIEEAIDIFGKTDTKEIIEYIITKILDRFIPSFLAFVLKENVHADNLEIICFENMKQVKDFFTINNLSAFIHFFESKPDIITFKNLEEGIGRPEVTDPLKVLRPAYIIPIIGNYEFYGFIVIGEKVLGQEYSSQELEHFTKLIQFISISFQNNINYISAITDPKTGAYSLPYFKTRMEEELSRITRHQREAALLMIDIDHFKKINDTYGHMAGDSILKSLVMLLKKELRKVDQVCRFGGEEFAILLVETSASYTELVAERIRNTIENYHFLYNNIDIHVTVSLGIRNINKEDTDSPESLITQADKALYEAKNSGRNRWFSYKKGSL